MNVITAPDMRGVLAAHRLVVNWRKKQKLISSLVFTEIYFLYSLWSQVSLILKWCASQLTVALLESRQRHA